MDERNPQTPDAQPTAPAPSRPVYKLTDGEQAFLSPIVKAMQELNGRLAAGVDLMHCQQQLEGRYGLTPDATALVPVE